MDVYDLQKTGFMRESFWKDESGIGTVELVLILVVLIGLVIIFRDSIQSLLKTLFSRIEGAAIGLF